MSEKIKDIDFMSDIDAATHLQAHWGARFMLLAITALVVFLIAWSSLSEIEIITRGSGQVVPSSETQIIQSLEGGILKELLVNEGQHVKKGQILMRISDVAFSSEERGTEARTYSLLVKRARLSAEAAAEELYIPSELANNVPEIVRNERALYESRQKQLTSAKDILDNKIKTIKAQIQETRAEINRFRENKTLLEEELAITKRMVAQQAVPKLEEIRLRRDLSDLNGKLDSRAEKVKGLAAELEAAQQERADQDNKFKSQALGELNEIETQINQLKENLKSIEDRVYRAELRSPVDGVVNEISVTTVGGVIEPAQSLMEIVPTEDALKIIARVQPSDIAFLKNGQSAKVKVSAYDPQRYGSLSGKLVRISANSVNDREGNIFFEIEVHTDQNHLDAGGVKLPITSGMVADVEIITGKRTIMDYMLKPILRARDKALTER